MYPFRVKTPVYRKNRKVCKHYKSYKNTLRKDFNSRCGYCNDADANRIRNYIIDHFVPRQPTGWTHKIQPNYYYNLIYSCSFCNGAKSNKWVTKKSNKHNDGTSGFIKPTNRNYGKIFERDLNGNIVYDSANSLAKYIHAELNLGAPIHAWNWQVERYSYQIEELEKINAAKKYPALFPKIKSLKLLRDEVMQSILIHYNS